VVWLSVKQTGTPIPQAVYGFQLEKVSAMEQQLMDDPKEQEVREIFQGARCRLAEKLKDPAALARQGSREKKSADLKAANAPDADSRRQKRRCMPCPRTRPPPSRPGPRPRRLPIPRPSR
jgi:cation/acetate symporter